jgi:hypothetical protein
MWPSAKVDVTPAMIRGGQVNPHRRDQVTAG